MKRFFKTILITVFIFNIFFTAATAQEKAVPPQIPQLSLTDATETFENGCKAFNGSFKIVNLSGSWREMGRQYGHLMKSELSEVFTFVQSIIEYKIGNAAIVNNIVETQTKQTPYRIIQFFEGAAETSGFTVKELHIINAVERIGGLPKCSLIMAWGDYAEDKLIIGRNYDYSEAFALLKDDVVVTVYHPSDGALATATIGYAGEIYAVNALNEKGVFLELNNGKPSANIKAPAPRITGTTMLLNVLFEADDLDDLELFFNTVNCSSSYIINVADKHKGHSYEWCPVGVKRGEKSLPDGLLVSTNYYVNPDWLFVTPSDASSWEGITRRKNLITLCEQKKGSINAETMMKIIATTLDNGGAMNPLTVYQMVVVPETFTLYLKVVGGSDWTEIDLKSFLIQFADK